MDDNIKDIVERLGALENRVLTLERQKRSVFLKKKKVVQSKKELSLGEFLIEKKPSDDVKRTLAIGYFLEKFKKFASFNADDLLSAYEKAKEKKPLNINDKVNMNIKNGHMDEVSEKKDNKKAWHVTNSGAKLVENELNK